MTEQMPRWNFIDASNKGLKQPLLVLIGPTAIGKTKLSIELAKHWDAEIISGDSMQVYRGMDIGTAKIKQDEMQQVPHHMIDICSPYESFSAADFQDKATETIHTLAARNKLPFVVGGTGLYIESLCYRFQFPPLGSDELFRKEQEELALKHGNSYIHNKLAEIDPEAAQRLHPNDTRRVIRALEIYHLSGETYTYQQRSQKKESPYELCIIGLTMDRAALYSRIEERIDIMMEEGLLGEVQQLLAHDMQPATVPMQALGYKEMAMYLRGECSLDTAVELLKRDTRRFAKRQLSWFRQMEGIEWIDMDENFHNNLQTIHGIIAGKFDLYREY